MLGAHLLQEQSGRRPAPRRGSRLQPGRIPQAAVGAAGAAAGLESSRTRDSGYCNRRRLRRGSNVYAARHSRLETRSALRALYAAAHPPGVLHFDYQAAGARVRQAFFTSDSGVRRLWNVTCAPFVESSGVGINAMDMCLQCFRISAEDDLRVCLRRTPKHRAQDSLYNGSPRRLESTEQG